MLSKSVTNEWINEKGTIPLQPSAKVINIFQGKWRAPAVTEGSKKGRRKRNGLSIANVVIYITRTKNVFETSMPISLSKGRPIEEAQLKRWGCRMSLEFRIREDGCVLEMFHDLQHQQQDASASPTGTALSMGPSYSRAIDWSLTFSKTAKRHSSASQEPEAWGGVCGTGCTLLSPFLHRAGRHLSL